MEEHRLLPDTDMVDIPMEESNGGIKLAGVPSAKHGTCNEAEDRIHPG